MSKAKCIRGGLQKATEALAHLVFPPRCFLCDWPSANPICPDCLANLPLVDGVACSRCGKPTLYDVGECRECRGRSFAFSGVTAAGYYEGALKNAIHALKYGNGKRLAGPLAKLVVERLNRGNPDVDQLSFVPVARKKQLERGYNQAQLIAAHIGVALEKPLVQSLRRNGVRSQSGLTFTERQENVRQAFHIIRPVEGRVLLVDDVYTTGSTVDACARELIKAGAEEVFVACVARTVADKTKALSPG